MNQLAKPMLLEEMAQKYGLHPEEFSRTVRATCGLTNASPEEFAAFVSVCREYKLNPILKEIYAYPRKGGGIVPVVSIDGWVHLINESGMCDGFDFEAEEVDGRLVSMTCHMYRKDRQRPVVVTEYLSECARATEPWKMAHRMLRHKTLIQAARYAFGFSGIYDEDEAQRMVDVTPQAAPPPRDVTPPKKDTQPAPKPSQARAAFGGALTPPKPPVKAPPPEEEPSEAEIIDAETGEVMLPGELLSELDDALGTAKTLEEIETIYADYALEARLKELPQGEEFVGVAVGIKRKHVKRVSE